MMRVRAFLLVSALSAAATTEAQTPDPAVDPPLPPTPAEQPPVVGPSPELVPGPPPALPSPDLEAPPGGDDAAMLGAEPPGGALTAEELEALGFSATTPAVDTSLKLSGFMDFSVVSALTDDTRSLIGRPAFAIGNVNTYISKNLSESFRTMAEIRFSYLPNGAPQSMTNPARTSTTVIDYADMGRASARWGGVELERVYLEWKASQYLTVRGGSFLTPYGIWNVDHGTPTIISAQRPYVIGEGFFPERQTGLELYGRAYIGNDHALNYHLTLSNGGGPYSEFLDLDRNKAVGGRLAWEYRKLGFLRIGASIYYGRDTNSTASGALVNGTPVTTEKVVSQFDRLSVAADVMYQYKGFHAQGELITRQMKFTEAGRYAALSLADFQSHYLADNFSWGGYFLLGYRLKWGGIMPYVVAQRLETMQDADKLGSTPILAGLNIRPIDAVVFKLEYMHVRFDEANIFPKQPLKALTAQAAWAF